jgi:hypothetical protein
MGRWDPAGEGRLESEEERKEEEGIRIDLISTGGR